MIKQRKNYVRDIGVDINYQSRSIQRFINIFNKDGQKQRAEKLVYEAINKLMENEACKLLQVNDVMDTIMKNISPTVEAVGRRIKGATLPVPSDVAPRRGEMLAFRWLRAGAIAKRAKDGITLAQALSYELFESFNERGYAVKRRDEVHATARANRAFAHFGK